MFPQIVCPHTIYLGVYSHTSYIELLKQFCAYILSPTLIIRFLTSRQLLAPLSISRYQYQALFNKKKKKKNWHIDCDSNHFVTRSPWWCCIDPICGMQISTSPVREGTILSARFRQVWPQIWKFWIEHLNNSRAWFGFCFFFSVFFFPFDGGDETRSIGQLCQFFLFPPMRQFKRSGRMPAETWDLRMRKDGNAIH